MFSVLHKEVGVKKSIELFSEIHSDINLLQAFSLFM